MDQSKGLMTTMAVAVVVLTCAVIYLIYQDQQEPASAVQPTSNDGPPIGCEYPAPEWCEYMSGYDDTAAQQREQLEEIEASQKRVECEMKKAQDVPGYRYRSCNVYSGP